jgi:hypothetical protein
MYDVAGKWLLYLQVPLFERYVLSYRYLFVRHFDVKVLAKVKIWLLCHRQNNELNHTNLGVYFLFTVIQKNQNLKNTKKKKIIKQDLHIFGSD